MANAIPPMPRKGANLGVNSAEAIVGRCVGRCWWGGSQEGGDGLVESVLVVRVVMVFQPDIEWWL